MNDEIVGLAIVSVEWLTADDAEKQGIPMHGHNKVQKIVLEDGSYLTALSDSEGNGPGWSIRGAGRASFHIMPKD